MESLGKSLGKKPQALRPLRFGPWDFPRDSIHHDTPLSLPHIVPIYFLADPGSARGCSTITSVIH